VSSSKHVEEGLTEMGGGRRAYLDQNAFTQLDAFTRGDRTRYSTVPLAEKRSSNS